MPPPPPPLDTEYAANLVVSSKYYWVTGSYCDMSKMHENVITLYENIYLFINTSFVEMLLKLGYTA